MWIPRENLPGEAIGLDKYKQLWCYPSLGFTAADDDDDELYYSLNVLWLGTCALLIGETLLRIVTTKLKT